VKPFPGVRELFVRLRQRGKRIALASSASAHELKTFESLLQIGDLVNDETSKDDASQSKPEPDIFEAALRRLGSPHPGRCVVVGDTPYDAVAAGRAGIPTIGVL